MGSENGDKQNERITGSREVEANDAHVHPAWRAFMRFCSDLRHGEIEQVKIQDGLPLLAEVAKKKVKFT